LYLVATPIGNLDDITMRALSVLREADLIAAEDTRHTKKLLNHFEIRTPLISYHEHSSIAREDEIIKHLREGKSIALVSDAGLPAISDPGQELVAKCVEAEIPVVPIPGVNAALSALIASGLSTQTFLYLGFLPRESKNRLEVLSKYKEQQDTMILYEAPHRLSEMLKDLQTIFGNRTVVIARELTKRHEEFIRGTVEEVIGLCEEESIKGEITVIIEGADKKEERQTAPWWDGLSISSHVGIWVEKGLSSKEAIKKVSEERNISKREVYKAYHHE
jgi:16S rRNA (cytidine1402-2'-O)-methyltransferase